MVEPTPNAKAAGDIEAIGGGWSPGRSLTEDWPYMRRLLMTVAIAGLAYLIWRLSGVLLLIFAAILLAVLLRSFADLIARVTPVGERWALTVATISVAGIFVGFTILFGAQISGQITQVIAKLPAAIDIAGTRLGIPNASAELEKAIASGVGPGFLSRAAGIGYSAVAILADVVLVLVASVYLAADPQVYRRGAVKLLPPSQHARIFDAMNVTGNALRLWFLGQLISMTLVGTVSGLAYWWIGLPAPLALGTIAALTNFVPFLGPFLGAIPALIFAFSMDMTTVIWTIAAAVAIQQLEGNLITPLIQRRAVSMPPVLVLFAVVVFGLLFGLLGIFLAVPLAVAITVLVKKLWIRQTLGEETKVPGEEPARASSS
jgi:predicted PurR-regulated permease PerM